MISYTNDYLHEHTAELQKLAERTPVLISDGGRQQVLMSYDEYKKLAGVDADKPFVSLYDAFVTNMPDDLREALAQIDDDDDEPDDFSYAHRSLDVQEL